MGQNLTRPLLNAGITLELWALVLDPKWMFMQMKVGGVSCLKSDFAVLETNVGGNRYQANTILMLSGLSERF